MFGKESTTLQVDGPPRSEANQHTMTIAKKSRKFTQNVGNTYNKSGVTSLMHSSSSSSSS